MFTSHHYSLIRQEVKTIKVCGCVLCRLDLASTSDVCYCTTFIAKGSPSFFGLLHHLVWMHVSICIVWYVFVWNAPKGSSCYGTILSYNMIVTV